MSSYILELDISRTRVFLLRFCLITDRIEKTQEMFLNVVNVERSSSRYNAVSLWVHQDPTAHAISHYQRDDEKIQKKLLA